MSGRSPHREQYQLVPEIITQWENDKQSYSMKSAFLQEYPLFKLYNHAYFSSKLLPGHIPTRNNPDQFIDGSQVSDSIENLLCEIKNNKKKFTDFELLQWKDYNKKHHYGLMVLKFKKYPLVLKLFIETPQSLTAPFNKGFEPIFLFCMGGGINRHMTGFTRIPNLEMINHKLKQSEQWRDTVVTPRKWYWLPKHCRWITITGKHINKNDEPLRTKIPGTYAIIADYIECERKFSILNNQDTQRALDLCNYLELFIDPHIENFMVEKDTKKIAIVDTEHFLTLVGIEKVDKEYKNYASWYMDLVLKCLKDNFFCTKRDRMENRKRSSEHWPFSVPPSTVCV